MKRIGRALRAERRVMAVVVAAVVLALVVPGLREASAGAVAAVVLLTVPARRRRVAADPELTTETELRTLDPDAWVSVRSGSFEHLVVGPSGAYLLETKRFVGEAMLREGVLSLHRDGAWRGDEGLAARLRANARDARRLWARRTSTGWRRWSCCGASSRPSSPSTAA